MKQTVRLQIVPAKHLAKTFRTLWLKWVHGFNPLHHCQRCMLGKVDDDVDPAIGTDRFDRFLVGHGDVGYLCGVTHVGRIDGWLHNLHIPFRHAHGKSFEVVSVDGHVFQLDDAERVAIEPIPLGHPALVLPKSFTTCRNFQLAVQLYASTASRWDVLKSLAQARRRL